MNLEAMYIRRPVLAWINLIIGLTLLGTSTSAIARNYKNFQLPKRPIRAVPPSNLSFRDKRIQLKGTFRTKTPSIDQKEFVFAKQKFLSKKRDEAIKLLRQQIEAGYKRNLDNMLLRLGQLYTEKYMEFSYLENELYNTQLDDFDAKRRKKAPRLDNSRSNRNLKLALSIFTKLEKNYPRHRKMDQILFFIGFVNMEMNRVAKGSRYLRRLHIFFGVQLS